MPKKKKAVPRLFDKGAPYISVKEGLDEIERTAKKAAPPSLLEAAKLAVKLMETGGYAWKHGAPELRAAIAAHEAEAKEAAYSAGHATTACPECYRLGGDHERGCTIPNRRK